MTGALDKPLNVLVTSAGRRVELVRLLRGLGVGMVFAGDMSASAPALYCADRGILLPSLEDDGYVACLEATCREAEISVVIPTIDSELTLLADVRARLLDGGIRAVVSSPVAVRRCLDKLESSHILAAAGLPVVHTSMWEPVAAREARYPIVVKPRRGSSSRGVRVVRSADELGQPPAEEPYVIQPFVEGYEVTIDVVAYDCSEVLAIGARRRLKVRGGEVERAVTVDVAPYLPMAQTVAHAIGLSGPFNFQAFRTSHGQCLVSEVNARLGGGAPLSQATGGEILEAVLGLPRAHRDLSMARPGVVMMRYDSSLYFDEEDLLP
jgi:carbamoyl-phosphate synthase large subunit